MSCPSRHVCNKVCENDRVASAIEADLGLSVIKHHTNLAVVIEPPDEASARFGDFTGEGVNREVVSKNQLKL